MITTLSLMEEAANCSNISLIPASGRKIIIFYSFYQWFHLYQGVWCSLDRDFYFLSYVMAAIPVQLLICGSYNYFQYWYKIIINHKTAPHACRCLFLSAGVLEFGHVSFRKRKKMYHVARLSRMGAGRRASLTPPGPSCFSADQNRG